MKKVATILSIAGAVALAGNLGINLLAFLVMAASNILFLIAFWKSERELIALNSAFLVINLIGVLRV